MAGGGGCRRDMCSASCAGNGCAFVEYAPLETAWVPVLGENYLYLYCLWVQGAPKGQGYGRALMERCIADARAKGRAGVCMLGAKKQKAWLSDQSFARKFGFETVDTAGEYELLALRFDDAEPPRFVPGAKRQTISEVGLVVYFSDQCPFIPQRAEKLQSYCAAHGIPADFPPCGFAGMAKVTAVRVQQLGRVLERAPRDRQSDRRRGTGKDHWASMIDQRPPKGPLFVEGWPRKARSGGPMRASAPTNTSEVRRKTVGRQSLSRLRRQLPLHKGSL